jgi:hypothetical protein
MPSDLLLGGVLVFAIAMLGSISIVVYVLATTKFGPRKRRRRSRVRLIPTAPYYPAPLGFAHHRERREPDEVEEPVPMDPTDYGLRGGSVGLGIGMIILLVIIAGAVAFIIDEEKGRDSGDRARDLIQRAK